MGRPRKQNREPFWRSDRACYYVQQGTRYIRLDPDKATAWRLYYELMARPPEPQALPRPSEMQAAEILDLFLEWCQKNRAKATYSWHLHFCQKLVSTLPPHCPSPS